VIQLSAAESDETLRPSIYAHSGPLGKFALVGDGFESGDVDTSPTGALEITGELDGDAEAPNTVDVFTEGVELSARRRRRSVWSAARTASRCARTSPSSSTGRCSTA